MGINKLNRQRDEDEKFVHEYYLQEEMIRVHAQYEDKKFLELVGIGIIKKGEGVI